MRSWVVLSVLGMTAMRGWGIDTTLEQPPATIVLSAPARATPADARIPLTILLKNVSDSSLTVERARGADAALAEFHITVTRFEEDGTMVAVRQTAATPARGAAVVKLAAGETLRETLNLKQAYAMNAVGVYAVRVSRAVPGPHGAVTIQSQDVAIRVGGQT